VPRITVDPRSLRRECIPLCIQNSIIAATSQGLHQELPLVIILFEPQDPRHIPAVVPITFLKLCGLELLEKFVPSVYWYAYSPSSFYYYPSIKVVENRDKFVPVVDNTFDEIAQPVVVQGLALILLCKDLKHVTNHRKYKFHSNVIPILTCNV
jgi:hypothetical protein